MTNRGGRGSIFRIVRNRTNPIEEKEARVLREKEQEAPGQRSSGTSGVHGGLPRERNFVRKTSSEREIGCMRVESEISSCKFFFS